MNSRVEAAAHCAQQSRAAARCKSRSSLEDGPFATVRRARRRASKDEGKLAVTPTDAFKLKKQARLLEPRARERSK
eukprot:6175786-Pleurochrysis_carterae.AAC.2